MEKRKSQADLSEYKHSPINAKDIHIPSDDSMVMIP